MHIETSEVVAVVAVMTLSIILGLMVVIALLPPKGVFARIARFFYEQIPRRIDDPFYYFRFR